MARSMGPRAALWVCFRLSSLSLAPLVYMSSIVFFPSCRVLWVKLSFRGRCGASKSHIRSLSAAHAPACVLSRRSLTSMRSGNGIPTHEHGRVPQEHGRPRWGVRL